MTTKVSKDMGMFAIYVPPPPKPTPPTGASVGQAQCAYSVPVTYTYHPTYRCLTREEWEKEEQAKRLQSEKDTREFKQFWHDNWGNMLFAGICLVVATAVALTLGTFIINTIIKRDES